MNRRADEELLAYYLGELAYLHQQGAAFARRHPKIAARLELSEEGSRDPHVERLIEAVAFLTARVRRTLDQEAPELAQGLLDALYPDALAPVPSMSVARFRHDPAKGKLRTASTVPAGTLLHAEAHGPAAEVRFRTAWDLDVWPLEVSEVRLEPRDRYEHLDFRHDVGAVLRVTLHSTQGDLVGVRLRDMVFHMDGSLHQAASLYEALLRYGAGGQVRQQDGTLIDLAPQPLEPVGLAEHEAVLPDPPLTRPGFQLLRQYFAFPRSFLFLRTRGFPEALRGTEADLLFLLRAVPPGLSVTNSSLRLGCVPVVNLFPHMAEPIRVHHLSTEYRLEADLRHPTDVEIHSVREVRYVPHDAAESATIPRLFGLRTPWAPSEFDRVYWSLRRSPASGDRRGSDVYLRLTDLDLNPWKPAEDSIFARVLCTNRHLAAQVAPGAELQRLEGGGAEEIQLLYKPTAQFDPPLGSGTLWRLVSYLSAGHLPLDDPEGDGAALRELLSLHAPESSSGAQRQIQGITSVGTAPAVDRIGTDAWRGLVRGTEVRVALSSDAFAGVGPFLFATVLRQFLGLQAHINSFVRLVVVDADQPEEAYQWPALAGATSLL